MSSSYHYQVGATIHTVNIQRQGAELQVTIDGKVYHVHARPDLSGRLDWRMDGQRFSAYTAADPQGQRVWLAGKSWWLPQVTAGQRPAAGRAHEASGQLTTAMPGLVTAILVQAGDVVERGAPLVILEAMKMEQRITAPHDGRVRKIACAVGQVVAQGALLVEISSEN